MAESPLVTVLIPAFNAARWIEQTIASVLAERGPPFELLVVDDGSSDDTAKLVASVGDARVRCVRQAANRGLIATLNLGLSEARGVYVARLDADDLCKPGRLAAQAEVLASDPSAIMVCGWTELIAEDGAHVAWSRWRFSPEAYYYLLHFRNCIPHPAVMYRRAEVLDAGGYLAAYKHAEDFELWGRLSSSGKIAQLPRDVTAYRLHAQSVSNAQASVQADMATRIARERLEKLLGEPVAQSLSTLYAEQALAEVHDVRRSADQLARVLSGIWRARPAYCRDDVLRTFMQVEWSRRAVSFARRGVVLPRVAELEGGLAARFEGTIRGALDELRLPRLWALLPRTHP